LILEEVKKDCPYFYELKAFIGEGKNVSESCRANSATALNTQTLTDRVLRGRKSARSAQDEDSEQDAQDGEVEEEDEDEEEDDMPEEEQDEEDEEIQKGEDLRAGTSLSLGPEQGETIQEGFFTDFLLGDEDEFQFGVPAPPVSSQPSALPTSPLALRDGSSAGQAEVLPPQTPALSSGATTGTAQPQAPAGRSSSRTTTVPPPRSYVSICEYLTS
jgi:hypothetical protein